jgi:hypothetical protein
VGTADIAAVAGYRMVRNLAYAEGALADRTGRQSSKIVQVVAGNGRKNFFDMDRLLGDMASLLASPPIAPRVDMVAAREAVEDEGLKTVAFEDRNAMVVVIDIAA